MNLLGTIVIPKGKAGLVFKKTGRGSGTNPISLNNESGYQASLLRAGQKYHGYWGWKYDIELVDPITVSHDEIALVVATQGRTKEPDAVVGEYVPCDDFQSGKEFLKNGGFEGRQSKVLTERQYYINPKLFDVITTSNCHLHGMTPEQLKKIKIEDDVLGVVSSLVGRAGKYSEFKDVPEDLYNNYQNIDDFVKNGGIKGIQEKVLKTGEYSLNPWCIEVKKVPITHIPNGTVGVVVSHTGTDGAYNEDGTVREGEVGVCSKVLQPGNHAINLGTKKVYIIPTMEITLVWSSGEEKESANNYDVDLKPITILTKDRYPIELKLSQTINIKGEEAPKLISKILDGESMDESITLIERSTKYPAIRKLISRVIKPKIQKHFESISGEYPYLEMGIKRGEIEETALEEIQSVLNEYGVEAKRLSIFVGYDASNPLDKMEQEKAELISRSQVDDVKLKTMTSDQRVRVAIAKNNMEVDGIVDQAAIDAMSRRISLLGADEYMELERLTKLVSMKVEGYPCILVMNSVLSHFKNKVDDTEGSNFDKDKFISRVAESLKNHSIEISHKPKPMESSNPVQEGTPSDERVEFSVFSPQKIMRGKKYIFDVWAYLPKQYDSVLIDARKLKRDNMLGGKSTGLVLEVGTTITVAMEIEHLEIPEPVDTLTWHGSAANLSFMVFVPTTAASTQHIGKVTIFCAGMSIAKIPFIVDVGSKDDPTSSKTSSTPLYPKTAFASYSSKNRAEVLARVQGIKKIAPNLDIFLDVFSLRTGDDWRQELKKHVPTKDIFYLFWSNHASESKWVEREWRLALSERGIDYIDPVPLQSIDQSPPPIELKNLHFRSVYQEYIHYEELKKRNKVASPDFKV